MEECGVDYMGDCFGFWGGVILSKEMKQFDIFPLFVDQIPDTLKEGILYICEKYEVAVHLCACGCAEKTVTPLIAGEWTLTKKTNNLVSLSPSIGNFSGQQPYHAHYFITDNKVVWC